MSSGAGIRQLPPDIVAKIKSSTSITHLNGVIVDLVKNSLDANAQTVLVSVDFKRGSCIVEDDGEGIRPVEFESTGGLGKAHHTSRFQNTDAYGRRGLFLASLASLSLLTVTSRHRQHQSTNSAIFHHSKPVARLFPAPSHQNLRIGEHGTSVTVNNLFGNMPVRVKSRALALQRPDELEKEWENLRYSLVSLMLANPQFSKLVMTDVTRDKRISIRLASLVGDSVDHSTSEIDLGRIGSILAQSGMISSRNMDSWHVLSAIIPDLTIRAAISTVPSPSKKLQFISLGDDPVFSRSNSNILYNEVNRLMSLSDFGNSSSMSDGTPSVCPSPLLGGSHGPASASGRSWAKPINKWPMFYIRIDAGNIQDLSGDELSPDSERSIQRITDVLSAMILEFLKQQHMRPRLTRRQAKGSDRTLSTTTPDQRDTGSHSIFRDTGTHSSTEEAFSSRLKLPSFQKSRVNSGQSFNNWSRVKSAKDLLDCASAGELSNENISARNETWEDEQNHALPELSLGATEHEQRGSTSLLLSGQPPKGSTSFHIRRHFVENETEGDEPSKDPLIPLVDPQIGKTHMINSRTGQTVHRKTSAGFSFWPGSLAASRQRPGRSLEEDSETDPFRNQWVDGLLESWDNPVFARSEKPLATLNVPTISHGCLQDIRSLDGTHLAKFRGKIRRHRLATASIIAQVDHKFILVKIPSEYPQHNGDDPEDTLILIDQHAADERCRVERLFEDMFISTDPAGRETQVRVVEVDPIAFNISATESALFRKYLDHFQTWGIHYDIDTKPADTITVYVYSLPALIAERCRSEPNLAANLLRGEIWTCEEDNRRPLGSKRSSMKHFTNMSPDEPADAHSWVQQMSGCPQSILDLLNSRACRTAVMFNDPLSIEECKVLVSRLAKCAFPFQCAHGRPSMIPILDLRPHSAHGLVPSDEDINIYDDESNDGGLGFLEAFRKRYVN